MGRFTTSFLVKLLINFIAGWITLGIVQGNTLGWVFIFDILSTIVNFIVGTVCVSSKSGLKSEIISDGILGALVAYLMDLLVQSFGTSFYILIFLGVLIFLGEYFFKTYILGFKENGCDK